MENKICVKCGMEFPYHTISCENPNEEYRLPTAKEFFQRELSGEPLTQESIIEGLIEFAKLHCKNQLDSILREVKLNAPDRYGRHATKVYYSEEGEVNIDKNSIVKAYDLNQIK